MTTSIKEKRKRQYQLSKEMKSELKKSHDEKFKQNIRYRKEIAERERQIAVLENFVHNHLCFFNSRNQMDKSSIDSQTMDTAKCALLKQPTPQCQGLESSEKQPSDKEQECLGLPFQPLESLDGSLCETFSSDQNYLDSAFVMPQSMFDAVDASNVHQTQLSDNPTMVSNTPTPMLISSIIRNDNDASPSHSSKSTSDYSTCFNEYLSAAMDDVAVPDITSQTNNPTEEKRASLHFHLDADDDSVDLLARDKTFQLHDRLTWDALMCLDQNVNSPPFEGGMPPLHSSDLMLSLPVTGSSSLARCNVNQWHG